MHLAAIQPHLHAVVRANLQRRLLCTGRFHYGREVEQHIVGGKLGVPGELADVKLRHPGRSCAGVGPHPANLLHPEGGMLGVEIDVGPLGLRAKVEGPLLGSHVREWPQHAEPDRGHNRLLQAGEVFDQVGGVLRGHVLQHQFGHQRFVLPNHLRNLVLGQINQLSFDGLEQHPIGGPLLEEAGVDLARGGLDHMRDVLGGDPRARVHDGLEQRLATVLAANLAQFRTNVGPLALHAVALVARRRATAGEHLGPPPRVPLERQDVLRRERLPQRLRTFPRREELLKQQADVDVGMLGRGGDRAGGEWLGKLLGVNHPQQLHPSVGRLHQPVDQFLLNGDRGFRIRLEQRGGGDRVTQRDQPGDGGPGQFGIRRGLAGQQRGERLPRRGKLQPGGHLDRGNPRRGGSLRVGDQFQHGFAEPCQPGITHHIERGSGQVWLLQAGGQSRDDGGVFLQTLPRSREVLPERGERELPGCLGSLVVQHAGDLLAGIGVPHAGEGVEHCLGRLGRESPRGEFFGEELARLFGTQNAGEVDLAGRDGRARLLQQFGEQLVLPLAGGDAQGLEQVAVGAVVPAGGLHNRGGRLGRGRSPGGQQHFLQHFAIGVFGQGQQRGEFGVAMAAEDADGERPEGGIVRGQLFADQFAGGAANAVGEPQGAGPQRAVGTGRQPGQPGNRPLPTFQQPLTSEKGGGMVGTGEGGEGVGVGQVGAGLVVGLEPARLGSDAVNAAAFGVVVGVTPHAAVVPVGQVQRAIGSDAGIDRAEVRVAVGDDVLEAGGVAHARESTGGVAPHLARTGVAVNELVLVLGTKHIGFVEGHPAGRAKPGDEHIRDVPGLVGPPVMDGVEAAIGIADVLGSAVPAVVPPFENPADADRLETIVVVVAAPDVAEGIDGEFDRVAEVDGEVFELRAIGFAADHPAPLVLDAATVGPGDVVAGVAIGHVELVVGAEDLAVHPVVVVLATKAGQQQLAGTVGDQVAVGVGVDVEIGRFGDIHLGTGDADAHGGVEVAAEDGDLVGDAIAVGVFEHLDLVIGGVADIPAVLGPLGDPDPAATVDVDGDGVRDHGLGGEELHFKAFGGGETGDRFSRGLLSPGGGGEPQECHQPQSAPEPQRLRGTSWYSGSSQGSRLRSRLGSKRAVHRDSLPRIGAPPASGLEGE